MKALRLAVCDDRPEDRQATMSMLRAYLEQRDYLVRVDEYPSGEAMLMANEFYDLAIMDILMEDMNGIETAHRLLARNPGMQIIFCSATNQFAAESYDVEALRYLLKPVSREKLYQTLDKYFQAYTALKTLTYKSNRMDESIYLSDVLWIEAGDHKSIIHTRSSDIVTTTLFKQFATQLAADDFVQPIRYALVALHAIAAIPAATLTLINGDEIPISRDQRSEIRQRFTEYKMKKLLEKGGVL